MRRIAAAVLAFVMVLSSVSLFTAASDEYRTYALTGINIERKSGYLVVYTPEYGASTGTEGGCEAAIGADGKVISVSEAGNTTIPENGFVLSGSTSRKSIVAKLEPLDMVSYDAESNKVTILGGDYSPFSTASFNYTGKNIARAENTIIIYENKETTGTNTWGYEVCVNSDGVITSIGGNNNAIPAGGFVISVVGNQKQAVIDACKLGMTATVDDAAKAVTVSLTEENALAGFKMKLTQLNENLQAAKDSFAILDFDRLERIITRLGELCDDIEKQLNEKNTLKYLVASEEFERVYALAEESLIEDVPVEGRALWLRIPTNSGESVVEKTVKQIYDNGFNIVCIEALFDNTTIMPMPANSLFEQNPVFGGKDMMKLYIDEFHKYGIEVHLWMSCYRVGYEGSANTARSVGAKKPEWRNISQSGSDVVTNEYGDAYFLNPALAEVSTFLLDTYKYLLETYDVDGFQLDYVRYPENSGGNFGYDEFTKNAFLEATGATSAPTASGQPYWNEWCNHRAAYVTDFVRKCGEMIKQIRGDIIFSCDVAPQYSESISKMCQDSVKWMRDGLVDAIYPMAYGTTDAVTKWTGITNGYCENVFTYMGLRDNGGETLREQIIAVRKTGGDGSAFFSYSQYIAGDYEGIIDRTVYFQPALSPSYNAKKAILAQLGYTLRVIDERMLPALSGEISETMKSLRDAIKAYSEKLEASSVSGTKSDFDALVATVKESFEGYAEKNPDDKSGIIAAERLMRDFALIEKTARLSHDEEKQAYAAAHPLPTLYELPEKTREPDEFDSASGDTNEDSSLAASDSSAAEGGTSAFEKVFQVLLVVIMTIGIVGLPAYFYLNSRKNRIAREYEENKEKEDANKADDEESDDKKDE